MKRVFFWVFVAFAATGCGRGGGEVADAHSHDGDVAAHAHDDGEDHDEGGRVAIPAAVRGNLGITFVRAELRDVARTLRVPGRFEYLSTARREYRTMLPGRVELLVEPFARVEQGTALYRIDSPEWRALQRGLTDAEAAIARLTTRLASFGPLREAHRNHEAQLERVIAIRRDRLAQLESVAEAGGGRRGERIEAEGLAATAEAELAEVLEKEAELGADEAETRSELAAARSTRAILLDTAATLVGMPAAELEEDGGEGAPRWRGITRIVVRAEEAGVVEGLGLTNGSWANEEVAVVTVVRPERLWFRATGLQSDLGLFRDGLAARIVAPTPTRAAGAVDLTETMSGELVVGLSGDPDERTVDLYVTPGSLASWARPGVSAQLEIVTSSSGEASVAIPEAAVQRDGLARVFFVRSAELPDEAVRVEAELGVSDGRWVVVEHGLRAGDEVVLDGAFQLMLATSDGGRDTGGHFHADGTFHDGEDE